MCKGPSRQVLLLAPLLLLATGCGDVLDNVPPRPATIDHQPTAEADFPSLAAVPARPQLTYTLEQRREIAQGLVADRANARYAGDALRQAQGRPVQPDAAPPLPPVAASPSPPQARQGDLALAYAEEALARDSDDGSLGDFLQRLQQPPPAVADIRPQSVPVPQRGVPFGPQAAGGEPAPPVAELVNAPGAEAVVAAPTETPAETLPAETLAAEASAAEAPSAAPALTVAAAVLPAVEAARPATPPLTLPLWIPFDSDGIELHADDRARIERLGRGAAEGEMAIVVSGGGERAGLAMERARRVAAVLVGGGLPPARIAIEMGGESDVVVVYEAGT